ncbi:baseplate J/gp47 family protein [Kiloniella majae]|uniref:baseplate J/gp47 family protein n=1 Tax=Kiloniella majae TaxID=1938558 RepID=UPI000A27982F|nr:baseplate J/gp47 family protein [Kiloniella majae]
MPWDTTPLQTREERLRQGIATNLGLTTTPSRMSNIGALSAEVAAEVDDIHQYISYQADQIFTTTADPENLVKHGSRVGLLPHAATPAVGAVTFTGTSGAVVPKGTELRHGAGQIYLTDEEVVLADGTATVAITAKENGVAGNLPVNEKLSPVSPLVGVSSDILLSSALVEGREKEANEAYRARVLFRQAHPPMGGADADYVVWASMVPGVSHVWVYPREQGLRTVVVRIASYDDANGPIPTDTLREKVLAHLNGHINPVTSQWTGRPAGAEVFVPELIEKPIALDFSLLQPNDSKTLAAINDNMTSMLRQRAQPGGLIRWSWITEAVSKAVGEDYHRLVTPSDDIQCAPNELAVPGPVTVNGA